jgi:hypothetical protein
MHPIASCDVRVLQLLLPAMQVTAFGWRRLLSIMQSLFGFTDLVYFF